MEMAGKQFSPFMEMVMQPCLTDCATMSYELCNCVLRFMEMAGKQFSPFMEMVMQPCLTDCVTASYGLWKWLASSSPVYGNGCVTMSYRSVTMSYGLCNCVLRFMERVGKQFSHL